MKKGFMVTLDTEIHEKAKENMINISNVCNEALRLRLSPKKSDCPEETIMLKCSKCGGLFDDGVLCPLTKKFNCMNCERATVNHPTFGVVSKYRCLPVDHEHIRIPGFLGENIQIAKEIQEKQNGD